jgi:hypothetical protein
MMLLVSLPASRAYESSRATSIQGVAWNADNSPVKFARIRLRNIVSGRIQAGVVANEDGRFVFADVPPGAYLVELVNDDGRVLAVGHTFTIGEGETVATFVRLPSKAPWFQGFFSNAAAIIAVAAASTGITAVAPEAVPPVSSAR